MAAYSITLSGGGTLLNADGGTLLLDYEHRESCQKRALSETETGKDFQKGPFRMSKK